VVPQQKRKKRTLVEYPQIYDFPKQVTITEEVPPQPPPGFFWLGDESPKRLREKEIDEFNRLIFGRGRVYPMGSPEQASLELAFGITKGGNKLSKLEKELKDFI